MKPTMEQWEFMEIMNDSFIRCKNDDIMYVKGWRDAFAAAEKDISQAFEERQKSNRTSENINKDNDPVNHPSHYTFSKYEVIDVLEEWNLPFHLANSVKYIARAGRKDPDKIEQDLRKCIWYIDRYIKLLEKRKHCGGNTV